MTASLPGHSSSRPPSFAGQNLSRRNLRGLDLRGADFSHCNLAGADLRQANLSGANFSHVRTGLPKRWRWSILLGCLLLIGAFAVLSSLAGLFLGSLMVPAFTEVNGYWLGLAAIATPITFITLVLRKGFQDQLGLLAALGLTSLIVGSLSAWQIPQEQLFEFINSTATILAVVISIAINTALIYPIVFTVLLNLHRSKKVGLVWEIAPILPGLLFSEYFVSQLYPDILAYCTTAAGCLAMVLSSLAIARQAHRGKPAHRVIQWTALGILSRFGTRFNHSDLSQTDLSQANLRYSDLGHANLTLTNFKGASGLEQTRCDATPLSDPAVRQLLTDRQSAGQSYAGCNFSGCDLSNVNLQTANLSSANLNQAKLTNADLSHANLSRIQALGTNFQGAQFTGACVEGWNINASTCLDNIGCEFVYLRCPSQERRPSSDSFADGEFSLLFREMLDTVDLIFRNGIDWKAFAASLQQVQVEHDGLDLQVQSIEHKGDGAVVVRVAVPATASAQPLQANKATLHADLTQQYEQALASLQAQHQAELNAIATEANVQLKAKDEQIQLHQQHQADLKELASLMAQRPAITSDSSTTTATAAPNPAPANPAKLAIISIGAGGFDQGFSVSLRLGAEQSLPSAECSATLPANLSLQDRSRAWRKAYRQQLMQPRSAWNQAKSAPRVMALQRERPQRSCDELSQDLRLQLNRWLNHSDFSPIKDLLLNQLNPGDRIRLIIQTDNPDLRRLPWHQWELCDRYPKAEIALATPTYQKSDQNQRPPGPVRILAILGNSSGIDLKQDRALLEQLPNTTITFLVEPERRQLNDQLWAQPWDLLFFAGHSLSDTNAQQGHIAINLQESLTISQLKHGLKASIAQGLQLAIFNSCDGLGLATALADLNLPQVVVMAEPIPDAVAQTFLKYFLQAFSSGKGLYPAVRQAREQLQGLESDYPCASWLPLLCQNLAMQPYDWPAA